MIGSIYIDIFKYKINFKLFMSRFLPIIRRQQPILYYAVSCGEVKILLNIISDVKNFHIMSNSPTSYLFIKNYKYSSIKPYDNIISMGIFFYKLRPKKIIISQNDIWPFFYLYALILNIPIVIINYDYNKYTGLYKKFRNYYYQTLVTKIYSINKGRNYLGNLKLLSKNHSCFSKKKIITIACAGKNEFDIHLKIIRYLNLNDWKVIFVPRHLNWRAHLISKCKDLDYKFINDINEIDDHKNFIVWRFGLLDDIYKISIKSKKK